MMINRFVEINIFQSSTTKSSNNQFDNYSKTADDIYYYAYLKKESISHKYSLNKILSLENLTFLDSYNKKQFTEKINLIGGYPYELFIAGMIASINSQHLTAMRLFVKSAFILNKKNDVDATINLCFTLIQISQCADALKKQFMAVKLLLFIIKISKRQPILYLFIDYLFASVFLRLAVYGERVYKNYNISHMLAFFSINNRIAHKRKYPNLMYEHYLSTTFRLYAKTWTNVNDQYFWFKESLKMKQMIVYNDDSDEFPKTELVYLLFDFCRFLIVNKFKFQLITKYSRKLLITLSSLKNDNRNKLSQDTVKYSIMISKYFFYMKDNKFLVWYFLSKYFIALVKDPNLLYDYKLYNNQITPYLV